MTWPIVVLDLVLIIMAYLLGLENGVSTKGSLRCRIYGHAFVSGEPQGTKPERFYAWLYCPRCGFAQTFVDREKADSAPRP